MATVVDFLCPNCSAVCTAHSRPGEMVRCPHCYSFVTVPGDEARQLKIVDEDLPSEAPLIVFRCSYCQSRIETDSANAGLACLCPGCHAGLTIPGNAQPIFPRPGPELGELQHPPSSAGTMIAVVIVAISLIVAILGWIR